MNRCRRPIDPSLGLDPVLPILLWSALLAAFVLLGGCAASHHDSAPAALGQPVSSDLREERT